uniref:anti-sigma factor domain-containing protein n=1 Tax=Cohnella rhizosphaerae TaxID=1457232 RepID=UPI003B8A62EA
MSFFLLMEGLLPSARTDVQAWARSGETNASLGLLRFHDSRAHLYASNVRPEAWECVLLTIEPKGGSPMPTRPETVSIPLREATQ